MTLVPLIRAAQYLRMSTEHQQYSIDNQAVVIAQFAKEHGFEIVKSYQDHGKSGLTLRERTGLKTMLKDVISSKANYKTILVYDISRWGRFQDTDESAHYEFLCKRAGIPVVYCAEQFVNDGSVGGEILKALKRVMAGEYSRELGNKVYEGKKRMVLRGFHVGCKAIFGYRRKIVSGDPKRNRLLEQGEYKAVTTDRIVMVPGPPKEVQAVRMVFQLSKNMGVNTVVEELNRRGLLYRGKPWKKYGVDAILRNEKYLGTNVWGKTSQRLRKRRDIPRDQWVRRPNCFKALIDPETFAAVWKARSKRHPPPLSNAKYLEYLKRIFKANGKLTCSLISKSKFKGHGRYFYRFGRMSEIHKLLGLPLPKERYARVVNRDKTLALMERVSNQIVPKNRFQVERVKVKKRYYQFFRVETGETFTLRACRAYSKGSGVQRWDVLPIRRDPSEFALLCMMDASREDVNKFFITRQLGPHIHRLHPGVGVMKFAVELSDLSDLPRAIAKVKSGRPADLHTLRGVVSIQNFLHCNDHALRRLRKQGLPLEHDGFVVVADPAELESWMASRHPGGSS